MSPKIKMYLIHVVSFVAVFLIVRFITKQFFDELAMWPVIIAAGSAALLAPKPHVEEHQSGKQYGLRIVFSNKIIKL